MSSELVDGVPYPMEQVSDYEHKWNSDSDEAANGKHSHCCRF